MYKQLKPLEVSRDDAEMQPTEANRWKRPTWPFLNMSLKDRGGSAGENGAYGHWLQRRMHKELMFECTAALLAAGATDAEVNNLTSGGKRNPSLTMNDGVLGKTFHWINDNLKEHNRARIQKTYFRERTEGGEIYVTGRRVFAASMIKTRAEREREKREDLLRLEKTRREVEKWMLEYWAARHSK